MKLDLATVQETVTVTGQTPLVETTRNKGQIIASTSAPTEMQMRAFREARGELPKLVSEVNTLATTALPNLFRTLAEHSLQPQTVRPVRTVTTSSQ